MDGFTRVTLAEDLFVLQPTRLRDRGVVAVFTERTGGTSGGPFASLNLGAKEGDDREAVRANRGRVADALGSAPWAMGEQVHGARVAAVDRDRAGAGFDRPEESLGGADALVTASAEVPLAVLVADCVPLVLADDRAVAAVHVGWRGLAGGVVRAALERFHESGRVTAAVGPAIGPCHYEVGEEVPAAVHPGIAATPRTERRRGSLFFDLPGTVADELGALGVGEVAVAAVCTACEEDRFFSYRRDGRTGRQALVAARLP